MDEKDQAYLRGDMLMRLIHSEALFLEAKQSGLEKDQDYINEVNQFKAGLLAQRYLSNLQKNIEIPETYKQQINSIQDTNALQAARSAYIAKQYKQLKQQSLARLIEKHQVQILLSDLQSPFADDDIIAKGSDFVIHFRDIQSPDIKLDDKEGIRKSLEDWLETLLFSLEAENHGIKVDNQIQDYSRHLLSQKLVENLEKQWIPEQATLVDYFQRHPELGYIPERRQIGQIVVADKNLAEELRSRILAGESLFKLAEQYTIDPYGKQHSGDMGWLRENTGLPIIENALKNLPDGQISEIVETPKGFHLIMIVNRKPSEQKSFADIKDRVRRALINGKMQPYLKKLLAKHQIQWRIDER
jgi:peptidyl-prolyl cis-trans isomerase C